MKKVISIILSIAIIASLTTVFAANADNMQEVLVSVKERVDIPEEYSEFSGRERASDNSDRYNFTWKTKDGDKSINVSAYSDGIITDYSEYNYDGGADSPVISEMSTEEAKEIAETFVRKINPNYPYELNIMEGERASLYSASRTFPIEIVINGLPLLNESGSITVNSNSRSVTDFSVWYSPEKIASDFENAAGLISEDAAKKAYSDKLGMRLIYRSYYDKEEQINFPVYVQNGGFNRYINAMTGEVEETDYYLYDRGYGVNTEGFAEASMKSADLTPQEQEVIDNINGLISKEEIESKLRNNEILAIPADVKVNSISLHNDVYHKGYIYRIYMSKESDTEFETVSASVNAETGMILDFYHNSSKIEDDAVIVRENNQIFKSLAGEKSAEYKYDADKQNYQRYVNGIEAENDTASLTVTNGLLTQYSINYSNSDFPSIDDAMSKTDAEEAFFGQTEYKLGCIFKTEKENDNHFVAVYSFEQGDINPFSGKLVNWRNEEITSDESKQITYTDVSGHWAQSCITKLAEYGVGFDGGEFKPDEKITQADLLTLMSAVYGYGDVIVFYNNKEQADNAYINAISHQIIKEDERNDSAVLTRETASIYLIRAIGAEEYAKYEDIYVTPFDDVTQNKGYIALLSAMGIVSGDGGHFNPEREITRAEFAVMLYNYLTK